MGVQVTLHPEWVADLDRAIEPIQPKILNTPDVEGTDERIAEKALCGLGKNDKIGPEGRWWLEEHAKYDDEHPVQALEIVKRRVAGGESTAAVTEAARTSLTLMRDAMLAAYDVSWP